MVSLHTRGIGGAQVINLHPYKHTTATLLVHSHWVMSPMKQRSVWSLGLGGHPAHHHVNPVSLWSCCGVSPMKQRSVWSWGWEATPHTVLSIQSLSGLAAVWGVALL